MTGRTRHVGVRPRRASLIASPAVNDQGDPEGPDVRMSVTVAKDVWLRLRDITAQLGVERNAFINDAIRRHLESEDEEGA